MISLTAVPRRCVNLPPGTLGALLSTKRNKNAVRGETIEQFTKTFAAWLGTPHVFGAYDGRTAFQLALEALDLPPGCEIIFPRFTFPVMPVVAKLLGFKAVFCDVDPDTFNSGVEHIEPLINEKTGAVLATHLFGQPCDIQPIVDLARQRNIKVLEDCAHGCGVRINGKQAGTFGDIGVYSFAEGKNMPCLAGGAIAVADDAVAARAAELLEKAPALDEGKIWSTGLGIWIHWLITRPWIFGLSAYPALRLKLAMGKPLMDSKTGNDLINKYTGSNPGIKGLANLQGMVGLLQLPLIDAFNAGAKRNADVLTEKLGDVPGLKPPRRTGDEHIYVYYPLTVDAEKRDDLRHHLLRAGVDAKLTDMSDCSQLDAFRDENTDTKQARETTLLEICVYPVMSERRMAKIAKAIRAWAGLSEL
jgi:dTDP-4-amino-4,6-dideoxygalactose transaminase